MANKLFKNNLFSFGVISAISAAGLLFGGLEAKAQTTDANQMNQNQVNPAPAQQFDNTAPAAPAPQTQQENFAPGAATPSPMGQMSPNQAPLLSVGSQGQEVRDLQAFLSQRGYYDSTVDGIYGPRTQSAVRQFQQAQNLQADGIVGPQTWGAMMSDDSIGTTPQPQ
jgi:murein L,D-transpeptidase YcbB/YkuD